MFSLSYKNFFEWTKKSFQNVSKISSKIFGFTKFSKKSRHISKNPEVS